MPYDLTDRELAVLRLVAAGRTNAQIGRQLYISTKTASVHVTNVLRRLAVASRVQAAALAWRAGWTPRSPKAPARESKYLPGPIPRDCPIRAGCPRIILGTRTATMHPRRPAMNPILIEQLAQTCRADLDREAGRRRHAQAGLAARRQAPASASPPGRRWRDAISRHPWPLGPVQWSLPRGRAGELAAAPAAWCGPVDSIPTMNGVVKGTRRQAFAETAAGSQRTAPPAARPERRGRLQRLAGLLQRIPNAAGNCYDPRFERPDLLEDDYYRFRNQPRGW